MAAACEGGPLQDKRTDGARLPAVELRKRAMQGVMRSAVLAGPIEGHVQSCVAFKTDGTENRCAPICITRHCTHLTLIAT